MNINELLNDEILKLNAFGHHEINIKNVEGIYDYIKNKNKETFQNYVNAHNLNKYDIAIISGYTDLKGSIVNRSLRDVWSKRNDEILFYEYLLNQSLDKIPSESSNTVHVKFSPIEENEMLQWFANRLTESVQFPNFLSASRNRWEKENLNLIIKTSNDSVGRYIAPLTGKIIEEEVLFKSQSKFIITEVENKCIYLTEANYQIQSNYVLHDLFYLNITNKEESNQDLI